MNKSDIIKWYNKYNEDPGNDNELERKILGRLSSIRTWDAFKNLMLSPTDGILKWKLAYRNIENDTKLRVLDKALWIYPDNSKISCE